MRIASRNDRTVLDLLEYVRRSQVSGLVFGIY